MHRFWGQYDLIHVPCTITGVGQAGGKGRAIVKGRGSPVFVIAAPFMIKKSGGKVDTGKPPFTSWT